MNLQHFMFRTESNRIVESEKQQNKYEAEKFYLKSTACKCMQIFENVIF